MTAGHPLLSTERLTRIFPRTRGRDAVAAVVDIDITVEANGILGVIGPNGAGKTTLIDLLAGTIAPTSGSFRVAGLDGGSRRPDVRREIGYVPSGGRSLYPRLTAMQNLRFAAALHGLCPREATLRSEAALRLCGALDVRHVRVDRLSDGMVGRVTLARAMVHDPAVLLLDEPMRSIDPLQRPAVLRVIREYVDQPGKAAVVVTHDIDDVFAICDLVASMRDGRIPDVSKVAAAGRDRAALARAIAGISS